MDHLNINNYFSKSFELFENDNRTPLDCSALTIKYIVKKNRKEEDSAALLSAQFVNPDSNLLLFEFTANQTADLEEGVYLQALKIFRENGKNEEVWADQLCVERGIFNG